MKFSELGLSDKVQQAVAASGYDTPTPIQEQAIPHALAGRDVLGIAQTGTGKTAAFTLPMLSRLESGRARARMPRTLILEPTRELAAQVEEAFVKYGVNHKLNVALLIGGVSFGDQEAKIMRGADVLIATPGRLLDFAERGKLLLTGIEILVIDEADRMLDMGFIPDIERICKLVPFTRQTLFFSATMPPEITRLTETFLHNPVRIEVARAASTATTITQGLVATGTGPEKRETLRRLLRSSADFKNAIIFCNRKRDVALLHKSLVTHGFSAGALHGDLDQRARMAALDSFKTGEVNLLVCSDVAARGLDIPDVSHVFNFDVPTHPEDYVHRIGRTGRAGKLGTAISLVPSADQKYVDEIEKLIERKIDWMEAPVAPAEGTGSDESVDTGPRRNRRAKAGAQRSAPDQKTRADRSGAPRQARSESPGDRDDRFKGTSRGGARRRAAPAEGGVDAGEPSFAAGDLQEQPVQHDRAARPERAPRPDRGTRPERAGRPERQARGERASRDERPAQDERPSRGSRQTQPRGGAGRDRSERDAPAFAPVRFADSRPATEQQAEAPASRFQQRDGERPRRDYRDRDDGPAVVGLGDHVPSFLLRAVKPRVVKAAEE